MKLTMTNVFFSKRGLVFSVRNEDLAFAAIIVSKILTILTVLGDLQQKTNIMTENLDTCASSFYSKS